MVTIYDIAKATGYSPSTVSKALNGYSDVGEKAKKIILEKAHDMEYAPNYTAKALITKKSWMIGVLYSEDLGVGLEHPLFGGVLEGFRKKAEEEGYELLFVSRRLGGRQMSYLEHCKNRRVDAVYLAVVSENDPDVMEVINSGIPCVSSDIIHPNIHSVTTENIEGVREGMRYLINLGHRKIAHIAGAQRHMAAQERFEAYKTSLKEANIEYDPLLVAEGGKYDYASGYDAMKGILETGKQKPTAVFAACDAMAYGAMAAVREHNLRVPEDISFLGFDDIDIAAYFTPSLTTIKQDKNEIGKRTAEVMLSLLKGEKVISRDIRIPTRLIKRSSCMICK